MNTVSAPPGPVVSITCIMVFMPATLLFTPELPSLTWGPDAGDRHRGAVDSGTDRSQGASAPVRAAGHDEPAPGSQLRSVQDDDLPKRPQQAARTLARHGLPRAASRLGAQRRPPRPPDLLILLHDGL